MKVSESTTTPTLIGRRRTSQGDIVTGPISYVFWHWPRPDISVLTYERQLLRFQRVLSSYNLSGLREVLSYRIDRLPWKSKGGRRYEDWYVVDDFGALGMLNTAAIAEPVRRSHDSVAFSALGGTAGVYRLVRGNLVLKETEIATWIRKPPGLSYGSFLLALQKRTKGQRTSLWQRQMALGPTSEFCIHGTEPSSLPNEFRPVRIRMNMVGR